MPVVADFTSSRAVLASWARNSRFLAVVVVLDLTHAQAAPVAREIVARDALALLATARAVDARYAVIAGQLLRADGGTLGVAIRDHGGVEAVRAAVAAAHARMGEMGETETLWVVAGDADFRRAVEETLAIVSTTEGSA